MSTMTATRTPAATRTTDGTLSNEALRALSTADLRMTYRYAVRAQQIATQVGNAANVARLDAYIARVIAVGKARQGHDDVCVCGTYDRCKAQREQDYRRTGNVRDLFRAYND